jgi:hypothetical protein
VASSSKVEFWIGTHAEYDHTSWDAPIVGQLGKLRPIVNRPTAAFAPDSGGSQPAPHHASASTCMSRIKQGLAIARQLAI